MITQWWASLDPLMKTLWAITLVSSLIFVVQSILTFLGADNGGGNIDANADIGGLDSSSDTDIPVDGVSGDSGANLYTFRNLVNFCMGFGWTCVLLAKKVPSTGLLMFFGVLVGVGLVIAVMYLFKWLSTMQQSGNINLYKSAVGCQGKVYLTIPAQRHGEGKVQITINNAVREYQAITEGDTIPTGTAIRVTEVIDNHTLLVEELIPTII